MALKVLNWFQQKLHAREDYCPIPSKQYDIDDVRESAVEHDTEALLLHDILLNGILTIGTLGHEQSFLPAEGLAVEEKEENLQMDQEEKAQHELEAPALALVTTDSKPVSRVGSLKMKSASMRSHECGDIMDVCANKGEMDEYRVSTQEKPLLVSEEKREEIKTRTTLADLFAADLFVKKDLKEVEEEGDCAMKNVSEVKLCEVKKVEKSKEKKSMPTSARTINRLIRKVLRKKIHPEHPSRPSRRDDEMPIIKHGHLRNTSTN